MPTLELTVARTPAPSMPPAAERELGPPLPLCCDVDYMTLVDVAAPALERSTAAHRLRQRLRLLELELVADARAHGATWQAIGAALRISRQAAQQRYG